MTSNSKIKQNLIYIVFFTLIICGMNYFMSPYQNCIRDMNELMTARSKVDGTGTGSEGLKRKKGRGESNVFN